MPGATYYIYQCFHRGIGIEELSDRRTGVTRTHFVYWLVAVVTLAAGVWRGFQLSVFIVITGRLILVIDFESELRYELIKDKQHYVLNNSFNTYLHFVI